MRKVSFLVLLVVALGIMVPLIGHAECVEIDLGNACVADDASSVTLDGDAGNPDPLDGWIVITPGGAHLVCANDQGSPSDEPDPNNPAECAP